jgi:Putative MetA-pathway of phenol degradation
MIGSRYPRTSLSIIGLRRKLGPGICWHNPCTRTGWQGRLASALPTHREDCMDVQAARRGAVLPGLPAAAPRLRPTLVAATLSCAIVSAAPPVRGQDLAPRAYLITPLRSSAVTVTYSYNDGNLEFEGTVPITDATGKVSVPSVAYYHSLALLGRSANVVVALPYGVGTFSGTVLGEGRSIYRSGLFDSVLRVSVNLVGGPAMSLAEFRKWRQKTLLGLSLKVTAPTGQYDPTKLINLGANRWAFKPELGLSQRWGHCVLDGYASVWFFTENPEFFSRNAYFPGTQSQTEDPIAAVETHLSYDARPGVWVSLDGNFWYGGRTSLDGVENPATLQRTSRVGVTASFRLNRHQSLKVSYSQGAYVQFGGDYKIASLAWQYSWIGKPD